MASWSESKYRGKTSFNVPEMMGWTNKQALVAGVVVLGAIVGLYLLTRPKGISSGISCSGVVSPPSQYIPEAYRLV